MVRVRSAPATRGLLPALESSKRDSMAQETRLFMDLNEPFLGACGDCALACYRVHGSNRENRGNQLRPPCFTKLVSDYSVEGGPSCWMKVPETFVAKYLPHVNQKRMVLENRDGWRWPVIYEAKHGFQLGWSEFSSANELAVGDTLFFSFVEDNKFVVHVFDKSGCEKRLTNKTLPSSTMPSSSKRNSVPDDSRKPLYTNQTAPPVPPFKNFTMLRPDDPEMTYQRNRESSPGCFFENDNDNTATFQNQHRNRRNTKDETLETQKSLRHSEPPPRKIRSWNNLSDVEVGSLLDTDKRCRPPTKGQSEDYLKRKRMPKPKWISRIRARAVVRKAMLKKMNPTFLSVSKHKPSAKGKDFPKSLPREREGYEASFDSRAFHGPNEDHSFTKTDTFISTRRSSRADDDEGAGLRNMRSVLREKSIVPLSNTDQDFARRTRGGSSNQLQQDFLDMPEFATPRTPGSFQPERLPGISLAPLINSETRRKRGRPFKFHPSNPSEWRQGRDIFVSRRRPVTQLEIEAALSAAYTLGAHIEASANNRAVTIVLVMRQSFVYRNFVLGFPRKLGDNYMPTYSKEVILEDSACKQWSCSWNKQYRYITGRGWRNFAIEHCLEEDDVLLLHLISETATTLAIKVHIFRVVDIPEGLTGWDSHICPENAVRDMNGGATTEWTQSPRFQPDRAHKKLKRMFDTEDSAMTESSEELD